MYQQKLGEARDRSKNPLRLNFRQGEAKNVLYGATDKWYRLALSLYRAIADKIFADAGQKGREPP